MGRGGASLLEKSFKLRDAPETNPPHLLPEASCSHLLYFSSFGAKLSYVHTSDNFGFGIHTPLFVLLPVTGWHIDLNSDTANSLNFVL